MDKKLVQRRIEQRKDAISHCKGVDVEVNTVKWQLPETLSDFKNTKSDIFIKHNFDMISDATNSYKSSLDYALCTHRLGASGNKLKKFIKKVLVKLVDIFAGWFIKPLERRQSQYNENLIAISKSLIKTCEQQNHMINELYSRTDILGDAFFDKLNDLESVSARLVEMKTIINSIDTSSGDENSQTNQSAPSCSNGIIENDLIDYFDFEDTFRGDRRMIMQRQQHYVDYLRCPYKEGLVVDLGSGRGEILQMLKENGICAIGVDCYKPFVDYCNENGYQAVLCDALTYLDACENESLNGIVLSQVAEHVDTKYLYQLIRTGYRKLKPGCSFILETPNPESLCVYTDFYTDGSHIKPVSPHTLKYIFEKNGYSSVERISADYSVHPYSESMKKYVIDKCEDSDEKAFFESVNQMLFGQRDFVIVARK